MIYNESAKNRNDGVVVFILSHYNYTSSIVNISDNKCIELEITLHNKNKMKITGVYRSPSGNPEMFVEQLGNYLERTKNKFVKHHMIIGDINLNLLDDNDGTVSDYLNILAEYNFNSLINKTTREQNGSVSCIDHCFLKSTITNITNNCLPCIIKNHITDHYTEVINIFFEQNREQLGDISGYKKFTDHEKIRTDLDTVNWVPFYSMQDPEQATTYFIRMLQTIIDTRTTLVRQKKNDIPRKCWITPGLLRSINHKHKLYEKYKKDPNRYGEMYKHYKNFLTLLIKNTKNNYYKEKINENRYNTKNLWMTVKQIAPQNREHNVKQIISNGNSYENDSDIANIFNDYYTNVGVDMANRISSVSKPVPTHVPRPESFYLKPTNQKEIETIIFNLKSNKAPGYDLIRVETLKLISNQISQQLTHIINLVMEKGCVPHEFKLAVLKPIYKKGDKNLPVNYRPISLITSLAKIFEKVIKQRLENYLDKYKLLSDKQFGFRSGKSTNDAISHLLKNVYQKIDDGDPVLCIFLDLSKAFDTVDHTLLLDTLETLGIRGTPHKLFSSYLLNRRQIVQVREIFSGKREVLCGVPQGTVLGPILFNIYINELLHLNTTGEITSFADDTVIFYSDVTWTNLKSKAETDMRNIVNWFISRKLTISYEKTKFMPFTCYRNRLPEYKMLSITNNSKIQATSEIKYLGLTIDQHLRWDRHILNIVNTLRSMLFRFKYFSNILEIYHLRILYHALIESRIQYGILGWGSALDSHLKKLLILQKYFLKIIHKKKRSYSTVELFKETNIFDLRQLYLYHILIHTYKNKSTLLQNIDHTYQTRQKTHLHIKTSAQKKNIGQRNHIYLCQKMFNEAPVKLKKQIIMYSSISLIKKRIKTYVHSLRTNDI